MIEYYDGPETSTTPTVTATTTAPVITTRASATPIVPAAHLIKSDDQWTHADLRDYIVRQLNQYNPGALATRNHAMEVAVCKAFCGRWGTDAPRIARFAFERRRGVWMNAPVDFRRFSEGSDAYFAAAIVKLLPQASA